MFEKFRRKTETEPKKEFKVTPETMGRLLISGLIVADFWNKKGTEIKQELRESSQAFKQRPKSWKDIIDNLAIQTAKTAVEYEEDDLKEGMLIRNRTIKSLMELRAARERTDKLQTGFDLQKDIVKEQTGEAFEGVKSVGLSEEEKTTFKQGVKREMEEKAKIDKQKVEQFLHNLLSQLGG